MALTGMVGKKQNHRQYPGAKGRRPDLTKIRKEEAVSRQEKYAQLSNAQKLELLDLKFGKNQGAKKQRAKLSTGVK